MNVKPPINDFLATVLLRPLWAPLIMVLALR